MSTHHTPNDTPATSTAPRQDVQDQAEHAGLTGWPDAPGSWADLVVADLDGARVDSAADPSVDLASDPAGQVREPEYRGLSRALTGDFTGDFTGDRGVYEQPGQLAFELEDELDDLEDEEVEP